MDLLFLGTSSGTPTKDRNVTALALLEEKGSGWYLIDCGEGTQHQLLHSPLSLNELQAIFITHVHGDHCYGLPGLLASAGMNGRKAPLTIIVPYGVEAWINATLLHTQLYLPFEIQFLPTESLKAWQHRNFIVESIELSHRVPSFAYSFTEASVDTSLDIEKLKQEGVPQGPLWGRLTKGFDIEHAGKLHKSHDFTKSDRTPRKIIVGGDNCRPELLADACRDCQVLVHEATYTMDIAQKVGDSVGHSAAEQVAMFAQTAEIPHLVLTHFSPRYQANADVSPSIVQIEQEAANVYKGKLFLAEDFKRYRLSKTGELTVISSRGNSSATT